MKTASITCLMLTALLAPVAAWAQNAAPSPGTPTIAPDPSEPDGQSMQKAIVGKEREILEALKTGTNDRFGDLTADEAIFVDSSGPATKAQVLKNITGLRLTAYDLSDIKFVPITGETGLITYTINEAGNLHGKDFTAKAFVSSLWTKHGDKWLCMFSQETAVK